MADNQLFTLKIITPDRVFYEGEASMVEFNTTEGEIGVYKMHVPTTVIVSPGVLTITEAEGQKRRSIWIVQTVRRNVPKRDFVPKHRKPIFCGQRQHSREHLPVFMY